MAQTKSPFQGLGSNNLTIQSMKNKLIAKYHVLAKHLNDDERMALLSAYDVESSKDLSPKQLIELINRLENKTDPDSDRWRKRVLAAIGAWLRRTNQTETSDKIKAIACRAAQNDNFNKIPISKLRAIYSEFTKKEQTATNIQTMQTEFWAHQASKN